MSKNKVVKRFKLLEAWLNEAGAKNIRHEELSNGDSLDWIAVNGRVIMLQTFADDNGWDVFVPVTDSNRIDETICALAARVG